MELSSFGTYASSVANFLGMVTSHWAWNFTQHPVIWGPIVVVLGAVYGYYRFRRRTHVDAIRMLAWYLSPLGNGRYYMNIIDVLPETSTQDNVVGGNTWAVREVRSACERRENFGGSYEDVDFIPMFSSRNAYVERLVGRLSTVPSTRHFDMMNAAAGTVRENPTLAHTCEWYPLDSDMVQRAYAALRSQYDLLRTLDPAKDIEYARNKHIDLARRMKRVADILADKTSEGERARKLLHLQTVKVY